MWADDLTIQSKTILGLQRLLNAIQRFCQYWGLEVNVDKTKILTVKKGHKLARDEKWFFNGQRIEVVHNTRILGFYISSNGNWSKHRKFAVEKAVRGLKPLTGFFLRNRNLPVCFLKMLYCSMIEPIILYGAELWGVFPQVHRQINEYEYQMHDLDKPLLKFLKLIMGLPRGAPSAATLLELAINRTQSRALIRAVNYWVKISRLGNDDIMSLCLRKQYDMIGKGAKPWLYHIKRILFMYGYGIVYENGGPADNRKFKAAFKQRVQDIHFSMMIEEIDNLRSLDLYSSLKTIVCKPESYTTRCLQTRRAIALLRFNMKYSLPFDKRSDICKLCDEIILLGDYWNHFLAVCPALPPVPDGFVHIPYVRYIKQATRDVNHPYIKRLKIAVALDVEN